VSQKLVSILTSLRIRPISAETALLLVGIRGNGQEVTLKRREDKGDEGDPRYNGQ
jgi:hypothetical protein